MRISFWQPDSDYRLGVYAKDTKTVCKFHWKYVPVLIAEYILRGEKSKRTLRQTVCMVYTIVTTDMAKAIAKAYGVKLIEDAPDLSIRRADQIF